MRWEHPDAPVVLRVEFTDEADREQASQEVLGLVRTAEPVDPDSIEVSPAAVRRRPAPQPEPEAEVQPIRSGRPVLVGITMHDEGLDTSVKVVLRSNGRSLTGQADGVAAPGADLRMAATATLHALRDLLPKHVRVDLEWLGVSDAGSVERVHLVQTGVTCIGASTEPEWLYGSAAVRGDARAAAVRATLDALNRRLGQLAEAS